MPTTCSAALILLLVAVTVHEAPQAEASSLNETARAFARLRGSSVQNKDTVAANTQPTTESIAQILKALDTDGDGKVGKQEIEKFARSQGLSTEEVRADFADLDRNNDGELEASEIGSINEVTAAEPEMSAPQPKPAPKAAAHASKKSSQKMQVVYHGAATPTAQAVLPEQGRLKTIQGSEEPEDELNLESLQRNADLQAGSVLAETLAQQAQKMFQQGMQDEQRAGSFAKLAKQLRGNITALARSASAETKRAAQLATAKVGNGAIAEVRALQKKSEQIAHDADERRKNAKEAMQRALEAQKHMAAQTQLLSTWPAFSEDH